MRKQEAEGNPEAKAILRQLFAKAFKEIDGSKKAFQLDGSLRELSEGKYQLVEKSRASSAQEDAELERE